ncbi:MAG: RdgB/HAM1 family non-canonical purine NTP pyrophosphatase [Anaerolineales bacterium]|nr:RdgB/HAM1 family non-canonical purine NTP pyrophosphatase [Anaerolineales bacterium]
MNRHLLIATNNPGKVREIQALLAGLDISLLTPAEIGLNLAVVEDGQTYAENASRKAIAFAQATSLVALADDSGLEVDALDGRPGLHSNRFGPQPGSEAARRRYLLEQLAGQPSPWRARFRATVAIAGPGREIHLTEGCCEGEIIPTEKGHNGFGYDPLFLIPALGRTMAELTPEEKNRLSHRALAVKAAIPLLQELLAIPFTPPA